MMVGPLVVRRELRLCGQRISIIFMTAIMEQAVRSRLLGQGVVECLFKPFTNSALHEALKIAVGELS
jgi:FixJ family two-component response regulator